MMVCFAIIYFHIAPSFGCAYDCVISWYLHVQYNLNGSNTDSSFTVDDSNSFLSL